MVTHLAAQITAKSAPKIAKCAFPKRETYNSSNLLLYKKDKKDNDHAKKYKVWFLNSQSMDFKIETYNSSKLLLYKREKKDKCAKYVFWKYKVWFLNYKLYFLKIQSMVFRKSVTRCMPYGDHDPRPWEKIQKVFEAILLPSSRRYELKRFN